MTNIQIDNKNIVIEIVPDFHNVGVLNELTFEAQRFGIDAFTKKEMYQKKGVDFKEVRITLKDGERKSFADSSCAYILWLYNEYKNNYENAVGIEEFMSDEFFPDFCEDFFSEEEIIIEDDEEDVDSEEEEEEEEEENDDSDDDNSFENDNF